MKERGKVGGGATQREIVKVSERGVSASLYEGVTSRERKSEWTVRHSVYASLCIKV